MKLPQVSQSIEYKGQAIQDITSKSCGFCGDTQQLAQTNFIKAGNMRRFCPANGTIFRMDKFYSQWPLSEGPQVRVRSPLEHGILYQVVHSRRLNSSQQHNTKPGHPPYIRSVSYHVFNTRGP